MARDFQIIGAALLGALAALAFSVGGDAFAQTSMAPNAWWKAYFRESRAVRLPDGRTLALYCEGAGSPTVVLNSGLGIGAAEWRNVQDDIARTTRVCAYDRAGLGLSTAGPIPRDTRAVVADLESLLAVAALKGPYVMVGHSMGSYDVRVFADRHLGDVAGLVLVDPSFEGLNDALVRFPGLARWQDMDRTWARRCLDLSEAGQLTPGSDGYSRCVAPPPPDMPATSDIRQLSDHGSPYFRTQVAERDAYDRLDSAEVTTEQRSYGAVPLVVLTAADTMRLPGLNDTEVADLTKLWAGEHDKLARLSAVGVNRIVSASGHDIPNDQPKIIIAAVEEVVRAARTH